MAIAAFFIHYKCLVPSPGGHAHMTAFQKIKTLYKERGAKGVSRFLYQRYLGREPHAYRVIEGFPIYSRLLKDKHGLEIGGPSQVFSTEIPIYAILGNLDGCNFSTFTTWEGCLSDGGSFRYSPHAEPGRQFIREATDLHGIESESYDFVLASHVLEHCANPLAALTEWLRVLRPQGEILLILPDRRFTFDHRRRVTTFDHILEDFRAEVGEDDMTHFQEIIELHDLDMDNKISGQNLSADDFRARSVKNETNRCFHQHVFDFPLLEQIFEYFKIAALDMTFAEPYHQIILGRKSSPTSASEISEEGC